ncbi:hypothetical protein GCM10023200_30630 [Actinomycetospora chlora]|uniref:Secreted protein n=1 Tax=Actinomycetospora chlora TaxID=663608 RepID=A0ABP9BBE7_9PSEU
MTRPRRAAAVVLLVALAALLAPSALAHEAAPAGVSRIELSLGARDLVLTITTPPAGGGRMPVVVLAREDAPPGEVTVAAARPGGAGTPVAVPVGPAGRPHDAVLTADGPGPWEVVVADGAAVARVPVDVPAPAPTPGWVWAVRVAAVVGVVALVAALALRHRPRVALALGVVAVVGVTVAVTAASTAPATTAAPAPTPTPAPAAGGHAGHAGMADMPAMPAAAPMSVPTAMAPGSVVVAARTATPATAATPVDLVLDLTDSSGGTVVDDLAIHDDALIHLAVIGPDGQVTHVHPVRTAPGRYVVRLVPPVAGRYGVFAEMERAGDGGHQVARTAFAVAGAPATAAPAPGPGARQVGDLQADVAVSGAVAGRPARVAAAFSRAGAPVTDLQSWLGMAGHLLVLGPGLAGTPDPVDPASAFGHVHDMRPAGPAGTYGPEVAFDVTFPQPGRYALWAQVQRDWRVVTVPVTVDVAPETPAP